MKRAVVTGSTSFIGERLVRRLLDGGYDVYAVARPNSPNLCRLPQSGHLKTVALDMSEIEKLADEIPGGVDLFFHLAWEGTRAPLRDDAHLQQKNADCALNAVRVAAKLDSGVFVGTGSQAEYGRFNGRVDEHYRTDPVTEYGKAKLKTYVRGRELAASFGMRFVWPRIFSVVGEHDYPGTLVMSCVSKMLKNEDVPLTQCVQNWDFIYVDDVAEALVQLALSGRDGEAYNVASGKARPLKAFVLEMSDILQSQSALLFGAVPYNREGPVSFEPVVDKLALDTGFAAKMDFNEAVKKIAIFLGESE